MTMGMHLLGKHHAMISMYYRSIYFDSQSDSLELCAKFVVKTDELWISDLFRSASMSLHEMPNLGEILLSTDGPSARIVVSQLMVKQIISSVYFDLRHAGIQKIESAIRQK